MPPSIRLLLRFLADENFPMPSVRVLRLAGHDVVAIREIAASSSDDTVLARAVRERRLLLTSDRHYGELIFRFSHPAPPGVVSFRYGPDDPADLGRRILEWLDDTTITLEGWLTVVGATRMRQRPLP